MKIRVYYEDTDAGGIVYHSNYLNFCERARSEMFFEKHLTPHNDNNFFVVTKIEANFLGKAKLGDMLEVKTEVLEIKKVSIVLMQKIYMDDTVIYTQKIKLAFLSNNKPSVIPKEQLDILIGDN
jgi:acyl-CoA thioester hydrolase